MGAEWWEYSQPFRHVHITNLLDAAKYRVVTDRFRQVRSPVRDAFKARIANYGAHIAAIDETLALDFSPLFLPSFIETLYRILKLPSLSRIDGALHHHPPGSVTGWIHTDYCSAWFDEAVSGRFPNRLTCGYFEGEVKSVTARPVEYVRAATMIYYLDNDDWRPGDGGETAVYSTPSGAGPMALIAPISNTAVLFECTPHSYHRFIENRRIARNSIVLWLHCTLEEAHARFGGGVSRRGPR